MKEIEKLAKFIFIVENAFEIGWDYAEKEIKFDKNYTEIK